MILVKDKEECTGCTACAMKCPKGAISMKEDKEGFSYPQIDENLCIDCHICVDTCPHLNYGKYINKQKSFYYGGIYDKNDILIKSSSGGAFSAICDSMPSRSFIFGSIFDKDLNVIHKGVLNKDKSIFRKSKYLQSNPMSTFKEVKELLRKGEYVLYTGTSCQIDGLYAYLGKKPKKLYTVDLICHGVPSQKVFDSYIECVEKKYKLNINNYSFREKKCFIGDWEIGVRFGNEYKSKYKSWGQDLYMFGFLRGIFYRPSCYKCKYANKEVYRPADLTIGDFWGSQNYNKEFDEKRGCSLIIANSDKGLDIIKKLENKMKLISIDKEDAIKENNNLIAPTNENKLRKDFFDRLCNGEAFDDIIKSYTRGKRKSHSQVIRVIFTKLFPSIVNKRRRKVVNERKKEKGIL